VEYERLGRFYLGRERTPAVPGAERALILYDSHDLTTHAVCVGMTGSGKTGLCIGLLEEAAIDGVPAIAIDPKGDLGNLALTFPRLRPEDFRPWIDEREATRRGVSPDALARETAERWRTGLAEWGQDAARIERLRDAADVRIYTPGSDAGLPLAVLRGLEPPPGGIDDPTAMRERIATAVTGLLTLVGIEVDPVRSREHILLSHVLEHAWSAGRGMSLEGLIEAVQRPPMSRVGVMNVDTFFPPDDRFALAMQLNALLAAPRFAAWLRGEPLDVGQLLHGPDGRPRISIVSIAHLDDRERMFVVTLLLGELIAWMRRQPGTSSLRAILYLDEVFGYLPPTANPPSKTPLLTLLKQARAFGLGVVLATQNPVDLDYKALSNAGTWFVGRLQTERDKARLLDGLTSAGAAGAGLDRATIDRTLSGLESRVFLMHDVHEDAPVLMETRWVLSYLRGPLTLSQIGELTGPAETAPSSESTDVVRSSTGSDTGPRPVLEPGITEVFLRGDAGGPTHEAWILVTARLHFVRASVDLDVWRTVQLLVPLTADGEADWEAGELVADVDERDQPPADAEFLAVAGPVTQARAHRRWVKRVATHLYRTERLALWRCTAPRAWSGPGETEGDFRARLSLLDREARDAGIEKLRRRYAPKLARCRDRIARAEAQLDREEAQLGHQKTQTMISLGTTVLGALFGRKLGSVGTVGRAGTAARSASRAARERGDVARAQARLEDARERLAKTDAELQEQLASLDAPIDPRDFDLTTLEVAPRRSDLEIARLALAWRPV
jgi:hypothetical protein